MGETLNRQPEQTAQPEDHQQAVQALALYLRSCRSSEYREPDDPPRKDGDAYYLEARRLGLLCGIETVQLLEEATADLGDTIEIPHRLSELKDELPEAVRDRCIFY